MANNQSYTGIVVSSIARTVDEGIAGLSVKQIPRRKLKADQCRVRIFASALNFFDNLQLVGKYQYKPPLPFVTGSEGAGVVIEVGSAVKRFKVGSEVMLLFLGNSAAEEAVYPEDLLIAKPALFSFEEAAGLPVGFVTSYHGLVQRGQLKKGEWVLVTGAAGGMGISAIQIAQKVGARVIAMVSRDPAKIEAVKSLGVDGVVVYEEGKEAGDTIKQQVEKITDGKFCDVIYEVVGGKVFDLCVRLIGACGRLLVIGFAGGTIPTLPVNLTLVKGFSVVGVRSGMEVTLNHSLLVECNEKLAEWTRSDKKLAPIIAAVFDIDNKTDPEAYKKAYQLINQRKVVGKAIITFNSKHRNKLNSKL